MYGKRLLQMSLVLAGLFSGAVRAEECVIGFDIGSSGLRTGTVQEDARVRVSVDALGDVWRHDGLLDSVGPTLDALAGMPKAAHLPDQCRVVAGGYSAWRLAAAKGGWPRLADSLRDMSRKSGASLFVIPQAVEGSYGFYAAKKQLGDRLATPYILDIGGGSLQIASKDGGWGDALGQNAWRKLYCQAGHPSAAADCTVNPMGPDSRDKARTLLAASMDEARKTLGTGFALTGVSSSIVRGTHPLLLSYQQRGLIPAGGVDEKGFTQQALSQALERLSRETDDQIAEDLRQCQGGPSAQPGQCDPHFASVEALGMLLLDQVMESLQVSRLETAPADITNVGGILADPYVAFWSRHYDCYLTLLSAMGPDALHVDAPACAAR